MAFDSNIFAQIEVKSITDSNGYGYVEGFANVTNYVDSGRDYLERGAFKKTLAENGTKYQLLLEHGTGGAGAKTLIDVIGVTEFEELEYGLYSKNEINLGTELGREVYARIKQMHSHGLPVGMSIGFFVPKGKIEIKSINGVDVRVIKEARLDHNSFTIKPMNKLSVVSDVKSMLDGLDELSYITVKSAKSLLQEAVLDTSSKADEQKSNDILIAKLDETRLTLKLNSIIQNVRNS